MQTASTIICAVTALAIGCASAQADNIKYESLGAISAGKIVTIYFLEPSAIRDVYDALPQRQKTRPKQTVRAFALVGPNGKSCTIYTPPIAGLHDYTNLDLLRHELTHCEQGLWHK